MDIYLKERIVERLRRNREILDMQHFLVPVSWKVSTYNLAGLILSAAGYELQLDKYNVRLPLNAPLLDKKWYEFESKKGYCRVEQEVEVAACARQLWEREYGDQEAIELPFYENARA